MVDQLRAPLDMHSAAAVPGGPANVPEVERLAALTTTELNDNYLQAQGSRPVILTGLSENWPASSRWSLDFFAGNYGSDRVLVTDYLGSPTLHKVRLADYLDYVRDPSKPFLAGVKGKAPWYSPYWTPFVDHPELLEDFDVTSAVENWLPESGLSDAGVETSEAIMSEWALRGFTWLFIGPAGTKTPHHIDTLCTHAWNTQISGSKRFDLWPPGQSDPDSPPAMTAILKAGETLIIPAAWAHSVVSLVASISLTGNFFNRTNSASFLRTVYTMPAAWRSKGRMVKALASGMQD